MDPCFYMGIGTGGLLKIHKHEIKAEPGFFFTPVELFYVPRGGGEREEEREKKKKRKGREKEGESSGSTLLHA